MKRKNKWFKLDNAAKIFPPTSSRKDPKVFRFSCELKEDVNRLVLQEALMKTLNVFPGFQTVLKRGLFWYYLETTTLEPIVVEEHLPPCSPLYNPNKKSLLFRVTYYKKRINVEIYHALTDGTGALQFLKVLVEYYFSLKASETSLIHPFSYDASFTEKMDDSFDKYYQKEKKKNSVNFHRSHQLKGEKLSGNRIRIISGEVSVAQTLEVAHQYQGTMTSFITGVYMLAILRTMSLRDQKYPIGITIPVNLRNYFESVTARNFFSVIQVKYHPCNQELGDIIAGITSIMKEKLSPHNVATQMNTLSALEHNFLVRLVPLFIKDIILNISSRFAEREATASLSNVGKIAMPDAIADSINSFEVFVSTYKQQICMCSYQDKLVISFSSSLVSTDIIKNFFRILTDLGLSVVVSANSLDE